MPKKKLILRTEIRRILDECGCMDKNPSDASEKEPFYYLAPEVIGSINNLSLHPKNDVVVIGFDTTDDKKFNLIVNGNSLNDWMDNNEESGTLAEFVKHFFEVSSPSSEAGGEEMLDEIVDDDGNIIGNKDLPSNATFTGIGASRKDSDAVIKQVIPKSKRYYGDTGLGFVTW